MPVFVVVIASGKDKFTLQMESEAAPTADEAIRHFMSSELCAEGVKSTQLFLLEASIREEE